MPEGQGAKPGPQKPPHKVAGANIGFLNFYVRDGYRKSMKILLISVVVNVGLLVVAIALFYSRPLPHFYAIEPDASLFAIAPLTVPIVNQDKLLSWATHVAVASYTYDFANWAQDFAKVKQYYTPTGYKNFIDALNSSGNLKKVIDNAYVVQATVVDVPRIVTQGMLKGTYTWKVQIPVLVKYTSASSASRQPILVTLLIARVPTTEIPEGIAVVQFISTTRQER